MACNAMRHDASQAFCGTMCIESTHIGWVELRSGQTWTSHGAARRPSRQSFADHFTIVCFQRGFTPRHSQSTQHHLNQATNMLACLVYLKARDQYPHARKEDARPRE